MLLERYRTSIGDESDIITYTVPEYVSSDNKLAVAKEFLDIYADFAEGEVEFNPELNGNEPEAEALFKTTYEGQSATLTICFMAMEAGEGFSDLASLYFKYYKPSKLS